MSGGAGTGTRNTENVWGPKDVGRDLCDSSPHLVFFAEGCFGVIARSAAFISEERHESFAAAGMGLEIGGLISDISAQASENISGAFRT